MRRVTFVYPYYENPAFLARQMHGWSKLPRDLSDMLSVIVVDDGSPKSPAEHVVRQLALTHPGRLFRIDVDVRWNWLAARNVGAHHAEEGWLLLTDMDHVVPEQTLRDLMYGSHDPDVVYRLSRFESNGAEIHPHPNSWFYTREMFWRIGGYDESASGYYGTDGDYRRRCAATAPVVILESSLVRHEYDGDSSTTRYKRKQPEDAEGKRILRARRGLPPKVLSFPYHEVRL